MDSGRWERWAILFVFHWNFDYMPHCRWLAMICRWECGCRRRLFFPDGRTMLPGGKVLSNDDLDVLRREISGHHAEDRRSDSGFAGGIRGRHGGPGGGVDGDAADSIHDDRTCNRSSGAEHRFERRGFQPHHATRFQRWWIFSRAIRCRRR